MAMPHRLEPGELFEERYRVKRIIGAGGFAVVYLAEQVDLGREVALKVMRPAEKLSEEGADFGSNYTDKIVGRFEREAKLVSQLRDPNTITMYDYGQSKDGRLYMVFEFVDGISLKQLLEPTERISADRTVKILRQMLMSLQEAHAVGVLHRDIKPANVMVFDQVGRQDQIKLLDFGIATRALQDKKDLTQNLTEEGKILGTPRYMAPEQIRGDELKPSSDLYSVGLVAYEMLIGRHAITGATSIEVIGNQIAPESVRLPIEAEIPLRLRQILNKMIQKSPQMRYQQASQVLEDLEEWNLQETRSMGIEEFDPNEPAQRDSPDETLVGQQRGATSAGTTPNGKIYVVAAILALLVIGAVAYAMMRDVEHISREDASKTLTTRAATGADIEAGAQPDDTASRLVVEPSLDDAGEASNEEGHPSKAEAGGEPDVNAEKDDAAKRASELESKREGGAPPKQIRGGEKLEEKPVAATNTRPDKADNATPPGKAARAGKTDESTKADKDVSATEGSDNAESGESSDSSPFFTLD